MEKPAKKLTRSMAKHAYAILMADLAMCSALSYSLDSEFILLAFEIDTEILFFFLDNIGRAWFFEEMNQRKIEITMSDASWCLSQR